MKNFILAFFVIWVSAYANAFEIIAHRGVHQTYGREGLDNESCTATRIENTGHQYLENTIPSISTAYGPRVGRPKFFQTLHF